MKNNLKYSLYFIDYHNGHMKECFKFIVDKGTFNLNWKDICNKIKTNYISGLGVFHIQGYMQELNIEFRMYPQTYTIEQAEKYINANEYNKEHCRLIEHSNIGNY